jgi:hypothetical protein
VAIYKFTSLVYKTPIVGVPGRGQLRTLVVEQEAMAPRIVGGLASRMAHSDHIHRENCKFTDVKGLVESPMLGVGN